MKNITRLLVVAVVLTLSGFQANEIATDQFNTVATMTSAVPMTSPICPLTDPNCSPVQ